jgi:thioredoxin reductase
MKEKYMDKQYDVAVVGAGSAGLQAAQTLGRMRQSTVVLGTDAYRNDPAEHMHNFLGHDGTPPAELRTAARKDAEQYDTVQFLERGVSRVSPDGGGFTLELVDGEVLRARRVLLATGVTDDLPDVPGLAPLFGDVVAHCPFCHGHEFADTPVGVLGSAAYVAPMAAMVAPIASQVVVLTNEGELEPATEAALHRMGVEVRHERVLGTGRGSLGVTVELEGGARIELGGLFVKTDWRQSTPFAEQLGLEMSPVGAVVVDAFGHTSVPGVYAAGDMAQGPGLPMPMASVLTAASGGLVAAAACVQDAALDRAALG